MLSDVHGNAVALEAVLRELLTVEAELVVVGGDLTWGPLPGETIAPASSLGSTGGIGFANAPAVMPIAVVALTLLAASPRSRGWSRPFRTAALPPATYERGLLTSRQ